MKRKYLTPQSETVNFSEPLQPLCGSKDSIKVDPDKETDVVFTNRRNGWSSSNWTATDSED